MIVKYSYYQDPVPIDYYIVVAYKPLLAGGYQEVNRVTYAPPHANPANFVISVPTPAVHRIAIYQSDDGIALGVMRLSFVATPSLDGPIIIPPLMIKVGRGIADRDPAIDATEVAIPSIAGYTISWVEQRGAGPIRGVNDTNDPLEIEWEQRLSGGINLLNGKVFNENEEYWLYFEPTLDSNISAAVFDLTELLEEHIQDTSNPHAVTKAQVGLGNLPNAKSDSYASGSSDILATQKAVYDLSQSINNLILKVAFHNVGAVPANNDAFVTITHNLNLVADSYIVICGIGGYSGNQSNDNDITLMTTQTFENSFKVALHNMGSATANIVINYIMVKKTI